MDSAQSNANIARAELVAVLQRVSLQDRPALSTLYKLTSGKLFALCIRILNDRSEAEDVLQEVYLTVWHKAAQFDAARGVSPVTWLTAIARNRALDRLRNRRRSFAVLDEAADVPDGAPLADAAIGAAEAEGRLAACLNGLDARAATAIRAAFFGGQTYESLAKAVEMPLGSMKSLIRRSLLRLRACLEL